MKESIISDKEEVQQFFDNALQKIYWAKKSLVELLDKMKAEVYAHKLKKLIEDDLTQTTAHVLRLRQVFGELGHQPQEKVCEAMQGLLKDAYTTMTATVRKTRTRDMGIRASLVKVEHYEMATYSILIQVSQAMGWTQVTRLLEQNIAEAKAMEVELLGPA